MRMLMNNLDPEVAEHPDPGVMPGSLIPGPVARIES